jgi:hypothetical protein
VVSAACSPAISPENSITVSTDRALAGALVRKNR